MTDSNGGTNDASAPAPASPQPAAAPAAAQPAPASPAPTAPPTAKTQDTVLIVRFGSELSYADQGLLKSDLRKIFAPFGAKKIVTTGKSFALVHLPENKSGDAFKQLDHKSIPLVGNNAAITLHRQKAHEGDKGGRHGDRHSDKHGDDKPKPPKDRYDLAVQSGAYEDEQGDFTILITVHKNGKGIATPLLASASSLVQIRDSIHTLLDPADMMTRESGTTVLYIRMVNPSIPHVTIWFEFCELEQDREIRLVRTPSVNLVLKNKKRT